ncbi:MAG: hypothetical protein J6T73_03955 [Clostridia bacterium]|nr:hypothetical protein [Clostridia bacterium]
MKKIISVITALLILSVCLCPSLAFAASTPVFEVSSAKAARDEGAEITIYLKNSPGITSAKLQVRFDSALTLKTVDFGDKFASSAMSSKELTSPVTLNWASGLTEVKGDALFATLTFAAGSKAEAKDYDISLSYNADDVFNLKEKNVKFATTAGKFTVTGDSAAILTGDTAAVGSSADGIEGEFNGEGDYIGPEVTFDEEGNVVESAETDKASDNTVLWICIAAAALIIAVAVIAFIVIGKRKKQEPAE